MSKYLDALISGGGPATQLATTDESAPVRVNTSQPTGAGQVLVTTSTTEAEWADAPSGGGGSSSVARQWPEPPFLSAIRDPEFDLTFDEAVSTEADLTVLGYTVRNGTGQFATRVGDVLPDGQIAEDPTQTYRSTVTGDCLLIQANSRLIIYRAVISPVNWQGCYKLEATPYSAGPTTANTEDGVMMLLAGQEPVSSNGQFLAGIQPNLATVMGVRFNGSVWQPWARNSFNGVDSYYASNDANSSQMIQLDMDTFVGCRTLAFGPARGYMFWFDSVARRCRLAQGASGNHQMPDTVTYAGFMLQPSIDILSQRGVVAIRSLRRAVS